MRDQTATSAQEQHVEDGAATYRRMSWRNSYWLVILIAVLIGVLTIVANVAMDWVTKGNLRGMLPSDVLDAAAAAALSGFVLIRMQSHRRELLGRMQIIEDVNHHVRNALTAITLSSSLREDPELNAKVRDACDRIDWVLHDVLSQTSSDTTLKGEHSRWHSGRRLLKKVKSKRPAAQGS
jgi:signal transduction histidine kinase